jgi:hypothetical protein
MGNAGSLGARRTDQQDSRDSERASSDPAKKRKNGGG